MNMMTLVEQLRTRDPALTSVDLVFEGDELAGDLAKQNVNELTVALLSSKTVTKVHLTVTKSADESRGTVPQWKPILRAVSNMERLTDLSITAFYDRTGKHTLRLSSLTCVLQNARNLQKLTLDSVGFLDDDAKCFAVLQEACRQHESITHLEITNYYFGQFRMPNWWSQSSRLVQALAAAPAVRALRLSSMAPFCRRPNLTLECLNTLFSHPTLVSLTLQDLVIWGSGSGKVAAESLRRNSKLEELELRSCVLAGDASILAGLDGNATLQRLDMTDADLSMEAPAIAKALVKNKVLQSCILSKARLGGDEEAHHSNLCNIIRALENHPTMTELAIQGMHSYIYEDKTRPVSFIRLALDVIVTVLESNRVLTEIRMDEVGVHDEILGLQKSDVNFYLHLNRSGYWELSQDGNDKTEWVESMASATEQVGCLFVLLQDNPLLCQTEERREIV
jgi:hypothetical protein